MGMDDDAEIGALPSGGSPFTSGSAGTPTPPPTNIGTAMPEDSAARSLITHFGNKATFGALPWLAAQKDTLVNAIGNQDFSDYGDKEAALQLMKRARLEKQTQDSPIASVTGDVGGIVAPMLPALGFIKDIPAFNNIGGTTAMTRGPAGRFAGWKTTGGVSIPAAVSQGAARIGLTSADAAGQAYGATDNPDERGAAALRGGMLGAGLGAAGEAVGAIPAAAKALGGKMGGHAAATAAGAATPFAVEQMVEHPQLIPYILGAASAAGLAKSGYAPAAIAPFAADAATGYQQKSVPGNLSPEVNAAIADPAQMSGIADPRTAKLMAWANAYGGAPAMRAMAAHLAGLDAPPRQ